MKKFFIIIAVALTVIMGLLLTACGDVEENPNSEISQLTTFAVSVDYICEIPDCDNIEHAHNNCEIADCLVISDHLHDGLNCTFDGCIQIGTHTHCKIIDCTQTGIHAHNNCGIDDCTQVQTHSHNCSVNNCNSVGTHTHFNCGVGGCTQDGTHSHNACGVSGCRKSGNHRHGGSHH